MATSFLTLYQKRKLKITLAIILAGTCTGPFYAMFSDGFDSWHPFINGAIAAFLLTSCIVIFEFYLFTGKIRRINFILFFLLRSCIYLFFIGIITFHVFLISRMIRFDISYYQVLNSTEFQHYIFYEDYPIVLLYGLVIIIILNFTTQLGRKLGQGVLIAYITGKYRTPRLEQRVFMFANIESSDVIASRLGPERYHNFIRDYISDITGSIVIHQGTVSHYVEDEVVVSWELKEGLHNANCIRTYFHAQDTLELLREHYFNFYGFTPKIRAALHCGSVIRAEIGEVKSEILFFGDVLNAISRILEECKKRSMDILVSSTLYNCFQLPEIYSAEALGSIDLKGKSKPLGLFSIKLKEYASPVYQQTVQ